VNANQAVFASVIEPFAAQPAIQNVTWMAKDGEVSIQVDGDGRVDRWRIAFGDSALAYEMR
jgi:hypothetical protein